ncbi:MAG: hypothetical protein GX418_12070 [Clostridiales bacterium]|nr:hypothetical protein [Clostridiales bacterium]
MTEKLKQRAEIKKELQAVLAECRDENGLKGWPKATITLESLQAEQMTATIYCGKGETDSVNGAPKVRNHKGFIRFVRKYGCGVKMQTVAQGTKRTVQIALTFDTRI